MKIRPTVYRRQGFVRVETRGVIRLVRLGNESGISGEVVSRIYPFIDRVSSRKPQYTIVIPVVGNTSQSRVTKLVVRIIYYLVVSYHVCFYRIL